MSMTQNTHVSDGFCGRGKELIKQDLTRTQTHKHSTAEQEAADAQSANALDLAVSAGESLRGRLQRPRDGAQGEKVGNKICQSVVGVCNESLRVKNVATDELPNRHEQIDNQADPRDPYSRVMFVRRRQVGGIVVVVMVTVAVAVATVCSDLSGHDWQRRRCNSTRRIPANMRTRGGLEKERTGGIVATRRPTRMEPT